MLEELVQEKLAAYALQRKEIMEQLDALSVEEKELQEELARIIEQDDLGLELFSPRKIYTENDHNITRIKQHIEDLRFQEAKLREELEQIVENEEKYSELNDEMLHKRLESEVDLHSRRSELQKAEEKENIENDNIRILQEEIVRLKQDKILMLEEIKSRVEKCYQASHIDRIKCKDELKHLLKYIDQIVSRET